MTDQDDELEQIRARHKACGHIEQWPDFDSFMAQIDRAMLLRRLDAARAELASVREAAQKYEEDTRIFFNRPASGDRLAAALKEQEP